MNSKIKFIQEIPQWPQKSEQWLAQRRGRLTSSDGATALGINKYETVFSLLLKKCGYGPKFTGNEATKHGERYESEAINLYCKLMNKRNYEFGLIDYNSMNPIRKASKLDTLDILNCPTDFIAGSPDGIAEDLDGFEDLVLLEIKCPMRRKIIFGEVPEYYYPQVQLNMAIFDLYKADFIEYIPKGISPFYYKEPVLNIVRIHRDDDWLLENIPKLYQCWMSICHWRIIGIEKHPEYAIMLSRETKKIERKTKKLEKEASMNVPKKIQFRDDTDIDCIDNELYIGECVEDSIEDPKCAFREDDF